MVQADVVIAGGGVAGASAAYFLARAGVRPLLLEREESAAYHASGRSAEALVEIELDEIWQVLVAEGARFLRDPPPEVAPGPLVRPVGVWNLLDAAEHAALERRAPGLRAQGVEVELVDPVRTAARLPMLTERDFAAAMHLPASGKLAVGALIDGYLTAARRAGAEVWLGVELLGVQTAGGRVCAVDTARGTIRCGDLVCAAGAWAGQVARLAGALDVPLTSLRRTVICFDPPDGAPADDWPLVSYDARGIYFAPDRGGLLASPMDEDLVEPCDARPEPAVIELTLERLRRLAAPICPDRPRAARAGLRTFAPDRRLVVGEDPIRPGFFWLAGQGGWGIETSPAVGRIAADLLTRGAIGDAALQAAISPARFQTST